MDRILGSIIDDYSLYRIIEIIIAILILILVYLGIQITLMIKFPKNSEADSIDTGSKRILARGKIFVFFSGFFMLLHEFGEGFKYDTPDDTTYEFFELMALLGLVLLLLQWYKILKNKL